MVRLKSLYKSSNLTSVVNRQEQRLWIVGNGATEHWGSNKLGTDLQHDHKKDNVDNNMAVMSDLKQISKTSLLLTHLRASVVTTNISQKQNKQGIF